MSERSSSDMEPGIRSRRATTTVRVPAKYQNKDKLLAISRLEEWYKMGKINLIKWVNFFIYIYR